MTTKEETVHLRIPAKAEYIEVVRLVLYGIAARMGFGYEEMEDMKVAVGEACNNAVLHAYQSDSPGTVSLAFEHTEHELRIAVKDEGGGFDPETAVRQTSPLEGKTLEEAQAGGLGLYMMQALMDDVEIRTEQGTEVILTKRLQRSGVVL